MEYQCLTSNFADVTSTSTSISFDESSGFLSMFTPPPSALEFADDDEFKAQYTVTAGAGGAVVRIRSVTFEITYQMDVGGVQTKTETFLAAMTGLTGAAIGNGTVVVVGVNSAIWYSTNRGVNWNTATSPDQCDFRDVVFDGNAFYASGTGGVILSSPDGVSWTRARKDGNSDFIDLAVVRGGAVGAISYDSQVLVNAPRTNNFSFIGADA